MSTSTGTAGDMEKAGVSRVVERKYRNRVYRPARYYLTWYFLGSVWATIMPLVLAYYLFRSGGLEALESSLWSTMSAFFAGLFLCILSTFYGMLSDSLFLLEGDRGLYSLGSVPATDPVVTTSTFLCDTPASQALYEQKYHGQRIIRYYVHRWGRKGGCMNWPGKAGGKSEGFFTKVVYSWDEAEITLDDGTAKREAIEIQPCPTCNRNRTVSNDPKRKDELGFVRVPPLSAQQLSQLAQDSPGIKRGGVIDLRGQVVANRYIDELPWELADAIRNDVEFRASSRVDMIWDASTESGAVGMGLPQNAAIELFGLEFTSKLMRAKSISLHQTIAQHGELSGPLGGSGPQP